MCEAEVDGWWAWGFAWEGEGAWREGVWAVVGWRGWTGAVLFGGLGLRMVAVRRLIWSSLRLAQASPVPLPLCDTAVL